MSGELERKKNRRNREQKRKLKVRVEKFRGTDTRCPFERCKLKLSLEFLSFVNVANPKLSIAKL